MVNTFSTAIPSPIPRGGRSPRPGGTPNGPREPGPAFGLHEDARFQDAYVEEMAFPALPAPVG
jgi:hypothetical protein